ncbi:MAG: hypothetical protein Q4C25_05735 [Bacillota bacterium]|nr:hypothetical protein [Bacillota bacterium]
MSKLSKREKVLIYIMIVVAIVVGGVFLLVQPSYEVYSDARERLSEIELERQTMEMSINSIPQIRKDIQDYTEKIGEIKAGFLPYMSNEEIDTMITGFVKQSGMTPQELEITNLSPSAIVAFGMDAEGDSDSSEASESGTAQDDSTNLTDSLDGTTGQTQGTTDGTEGTSTAQDSQESQTQDAEDILAGEDTGATATDVDMSAKEVTIQADGSLTEFIALIGVAAQQGGVRLTGFEVSSRSETSLLLSLESLTDTISTGEFSAEVTFQVYMSN